MQEAEPIATEAHEGQTGKAGRPSIEHPDGSPRGRRGSTATSRAR